jgi:hypothetical protein
MRIIHPKYFLLLLSFCLVLISYGQGNVEDLLYQKVENVNMVYKPVVGVGIGSFNFLGDVRNPNLSAFNGSMGYKVNLSTFVDNKNYIKANFFFMLGQMSGNERSFTELDRNLNFKSDLLMFGVNLNYDFDHFIKKHRTVHPFISAGFEIITFDSKTDLIGAENTPYNYWSDGSIRSLPEGSGDDTPLMKRDFNYETGLRENFEWGLGDYPQYTFAVPFDAGLDFWLSDRVMFRVGTCYNLVFSDAIDHVSHKNDPDLGAPVGDKRGDDFLFSYFSLHLDLFSSDRELDWNKLYVDMEFDPTLDGDEDDDGIRDGYDYCPGTPWGVQVDTAGCAIDTDSDGIADYLDDEINSRAGAMVDERGVEMSDEDVIARLDQTNAVPREDISKYLREPSSYANYKKSTSKEIPEKFKSADANEDGYISFDEMMDAIDGFFDFDSELGTEDVYELNEFFFSQ